MFIRKVTHKEKQNSVQYHTYKIVEAVRTQRGPRQRTLVNLGADFSLPKEQWKELANRIEEIITGQGPLIDYPDEIEILARKYARKIIRKQSSIVPEKRDSSTEYLPDYETVDVNSTENEQARTVGAEHVVYHTIKELELDRKLEKLGFNRPQLQAAIGVIAARAIAPGSERATHRWLQHISALDELMDTDFSMLSQDRVYKASDMLLAKKEEIERHLSIKEGSLFALEEKIILYDLTNTFLEGSGKYIEKAAFGKSKEMRTDCPLVTMGLVLDAEGFVKKSMIFGGNVSEPGTLESMIRDLSEKGSLIKPIIVLDAGVATEDNILWLRGQHHFYIVVSRKRNIEMPENTDTVTVREDADNNVKVALVKNDDTGEFELYCRSTGKEKKEKGIKNTFCQRFEGELQKARSALSKKNGIKCYDKVIERIGRLKERYKRVAYRYEVVVDKDPKTNKAIAINWDFKKTGETEDGLYCLRTNKGGLKEQEIWDIYNMLRDIEDAFRCMKSELGMRPVHHQRQSRVDGHLFITVLAYHILHNIRFKLRAKGIRLSWTTIRKQLFSQVRITTTMKRQDGKLIHIRKSSNAELFHKEIYDALNLPYQPGKTVKVIF